MTDTIVQPPPRQRSAPSQVMAAVAATLVGLLGFALLAGGAALVWAGSERDDDGFYSTSTERFTASGSALVSHELDIDLDGADWLVGRDGLGRIRLGATSRDGASVFVGIARTADVDAYLRDVPHTVLHDVDTDPFRASYVERAGDRAASRPGDRPFWAASAEGSGTRTLEWEVEDGSWTAVVMNADGSRGVDADLSVGADLPILTVAGWIGLGAGTILLLGTIALIVFAIRGPRRPTAVA